MSLDTRTPLSSNDPDVIVDRRRLRRKLTFWRVGAVLFAIVTVATIALVSMPSGRDLVGGHAIARIKIEGLIRSNDERVEALEKLAASSAPAVIVHINSPGGTTAGAEQLYNALLRVKAKKPVVIVVEGLAASGGYIAALAGDRIISQSSSLVGSIGVLVQYPNFGDLLKTVGVKVEEVKSSPLKAAPNGFEPTSPEARAALEAIVKDSYAWFRALVKERRGMNDALLETVADGRVFTGRQAIALKLVDELGDERAARAWLAREKKISASTPVRNYKLSTKYSDLSFLRLFGVASLRILGLNDWAAKIDAGGVLDAVQSANLEGVLALWRPSLGN